MERDKAAATLAELFPALAPDVIGDVLAQHADKVDDAISSLLIIASASPPAPSSAPASVSHVPSHAQPQRQHQGSAKKALAPSWGTLGLSPDLRQKLHLGPSYYTQGSERAAVPPPAGEDFPAALPSSLGPLLSPARAAHSQWPTADGATPASNGYLRSAKKPPGRPVAAWAAVARNPTRGVPGRQLAGTHATAQQAQHATAQHAQRATGSQSEGNGDWQQEVAEQLSQQHPWAGRELVASVLSAVAFDLETAQAILRDMAHPAVGSGAASVDGAGAASGLSSSSSDEEQQHRPQLQEEQPQQQQQPQQRFLDAGDFAVVSGPQKAAAGPRSGRSLQRPMPALAKASKGNPAEPAVPEALSARSARSAASRAGRGVTTTTRPGQHNPCSSSSSSSSSDSSRDAIPSAAAQHDDVYWRHRGDAQRLTRAWQKAVAKAASAYSGGSHGKAQALAAEARRLRYASLAAHEEAASRIEAELNADASLFELDLHGLHAAEAVAALERRLELLQHALADATSRRQEGRRGRSRDSSNPPLAAAEKAAGRAAASSASAAGAATATATAAAAAAAARGGTAGGAAGGAAAPLRPASPAQRGGLSGGVPGSGRWELRVVVGRGAHSSGGEATIPRAVEARLVELGYKFEKRAGALDVALRRQFGGSKGYKPVGKDQRR